MAKFGYICKCGWSLSRGIKNRKHYAEAKRIHAQGISEGKGCKFLADELNRTKRQSA